MKDILEYIGSWSALTWIILVLIAGFVGQFGKMLAEALIRKIQLARITRRNSSAIESPPKKDYSVLPDAAAMKEPDMQSPVQDSRIDKKALKILAKQSKKNAKTYE
jgi:hypothetical protein